MKFGRYKREMSAAIAFAVLLVIVGIIAPSFFSAGNLRDLMINNAPALILAVGMTLVILVGQIDISVGSQFAVCSVAAGFLAKTGMPLPLLVVCVLLTGAAMGAINGTLIGWLRLPSIITRQQPHAPSGAHPFLQEVMPHSSRSTSNRCIPGS